MRIWKGIITKEVCIFCFRSQRLRKKKTCLSFSLVYCLSVFHVYIQFSHVHAIQQSVPWLLEKREARIAYCDAPVSTKGSWFFVCLMFFFSEKGEKKKTTFQNGIMFCSKTKNERGRK